MRAIVVISACVCAGDVIAVEVSGNHRFVADAMAQALATTQDGDAATTMPVQSQPTTGAEASFEMPDRRSFDRSEVIMLVLAATALALVLFTRWHRLNRIPQRPNAFSPPVALFLLGMIFLLAPIGLALAAMIFGIKAPSGEGAPPLALDDQWKLHLGALAMRVLGIAAFFYLLRLAPPLLHDRRTSPPAAIALGIAGLLLVWPMVIAAVTIVRWLTNAADDPIAHDTLRQLVSQPLSAWGWAMVVGVTVIGPLTEEVMYRGLLQEGIRRAGATPWAAIAITSAIFACAHISVVPPHGIVGLFVLALGFGWAYEKTGSLWAPVTMHALFNAGNLILAQNAAP